MTIVVRLSAILCVATLAGLAHAGDVQDIGPTVRDALRMQRDGVNAVPVRPLQKEAAFRVYDRYLESFTYPIPKLFEREASFSADGS